MAPVTGIGAATNKEVLTMNDRMTYEDLHGLDSLDDPQVGLCPDCGHTMTETHVQWQHWLLYCPRCQCEIEYDLGPHPASIRY